MEKTNQFVEALQGKQIPILILDNKWHQLFTRVEKSKSLATKEAQMNELLKRQGKLNQDLKEIKKLKNRMMQEIIPLSEELRVNENEKTVKKLDEKKRLIEECNEKTDAYADELIELPRQIDQLNHSMMLETMELCYSKIGRNQKDIAEIAKWIAMVRVELKKNIVRKQEREESNQELYHYMHDVFGADVIELFDMQYKPGEPGTLSGETQ